MNRWSFPLAGVLLLVDAGCGSRTGLFVPTPNAASCPDAEAADTCSRIPDGTLPLGGSPASGAITGAELRVSFCPGRVYAVVNGTVQASTPYLFKLIGVVGLGSPASPFEFQAPSGAADGILQVLIDLASSAPGNHSSSEFHDVALVSFAYDVPVPCFSCGTSAPARSPADCPPGCSTVCSSLACEPCRPDWPMISYSARSWELTLTSDEQSGDAGTGIALFSPHGTFTASLVGDDDAGAAAASLAATF